MDSPANTVSIASASCCTKRGGEAVLNVLGSFQGVVWRLFEDFPVEDCEKEDAFGKILTRLDRNFEYDDRVLLPNDFEAYLNGLLRKPQQSLLSFVTDHDEAYRKLTGHKINLPNQVQGWHLLKRAGLTREQRQTVTLTLDKANVVEALFLLYGQDYKAGGWNSDRVKTVGHNDGRAGATPLLRMTMTVSGIL